MNDAYSHNNFSVMCKHAIIFESHITWIPEIILNGVIPIAQTSTISLRLEPSINISGAQNLSVPHFVPDCASIEEHSPKSANFTVSCNNKILRGLSYLATLLKNTPKPI